MSDAPSTDPLPTSLLRAVAQSICDHCGYDLRGLGPGGLCPECGKPIAPRDQTASAYLRWHNSVQKAPELLLVSVAASLATYLCLCGLFLSMETAVLVAAPLITFGLTDAVTTSLALLAFSLAPPGRRLSPLAPIGTAVLTAILMTPLGICLVAATPGFTIVVASARAILPLFLALSIERTNRLVGLPAPIWSRTTALTTGTLATLACGATIAGVTSIGTSVAWDLTLMTAATLDLLSRVAAAVAAWPIRRRLTSEHV